MSFGEGISSMRYACFLACASLLATASVSAQSASNQSIASSGGSSAAITSWSSSQDGQLQIADGSVPSSAALPSASAAAGSAAPAQQSDNDTYHGWHGHDVVQRLTWEAGGGFNAPIGNDRPFITWGGNFTLGAGVRFSRRVSALLEYQFMSNKLPGAFIAAANTGCGDCGITGGNAHFNSITGSPVIDLTPHWSNGVYVVGGWGWYHKSTNFSSPEPVFSPFYGYYYENVTVASFTSSQWGGNAGFGLYHRFGGMYGEGKSQIFAEARYTYIHTPPITATNGLGTTELIPVTVGFRF
jgi:Outer membrane protein beta-barrel domain